MTFKTKRPHIVEVAFASTLRYRQYVIRIPEALAATQLPRKNCVRFGSSAKPANPRVLGNTVKTARCADTAIALKDSLAQVSRTAAKLPFLDTPCRTKCQTARWNFQIAPAAKAPAIWTGGKQLPISPASAHGALSAHKNSIQ
jgi:hypothetical protein